MVCLPKDTAAGISSHDRNRSTRIRQAVTNGRAAALGPDVVQPLAMEQLKALANRVDRQ